MLAWFAMSYPFGKQLRSTIARHLEEFEPRAMALDDRRAAAVAVLITRDEEGRACYVITRRALTLRAHPGQLSFPGGRIDAGETPVECALRETEEEIGLGITQADVLGQLDDFATRSGYLMTPIVAWVADSAGIVANPNEVAGVFHIPLATLDEPGVPRLVDIPESDRPVIQVPLLGGYLNAPSAAIIYQLSEVGLHGRPTRVAHYEQPVWAWR